VLLDDVVEVVPAGGGGDQADLDVVAPDLFVNVEIARLVPGDRPFAEEALEILLPLGVDGVRVEVGPGREIDLRLADVKKGIGIPGRQLPGFVRRQDVVRRGGDEVGDGLAGPDAPERFDSGQAILRMSS